MYEKKHEMPEMDAFDRIVSSENKKQPETKTEQKTKAMNENLNLVEILKDVPEGTELYSPVCGKVVFEKIQNTDYPILVNSPSDNKLSFTNDGRIYFGYNDAECLLFPSKDQRDWSKFEIPIKDKELVWAGDEFSIFKRVLAFYDANSKSTFGLSSGKRDGGGYYDHYERFTGEWPEWAKEAYKKLED